MKVGIMTMHRVENYGSFLQAYGLKKTIESFDNTVEFVDYKPEESLVHNKVNNANGILKKAIKKLRILSPEYRKYREDQIKLNQTFLEFCNKYNDEFLKCLDVTNAKNYTPELDCLVIGSDEVFNCTQAGNLVGYSRQLFGKDNNSKKLISYAASFGHTTLEKLRYYNVSDEISEMLKRFDALSVRDTNSLEIIKQLCDVTPLKHIDPVLMYEFPEVDDITVDLKDYIVVYAYAGRLRDDEITAIKAFAREKGKKILTLGFYQPYSDEYVLADPLEVLAYIKSADYVVTDTFHGTVFSIKYQVPFATIIRESNKQKLSDLLDTFKLDNRRVMEINKLKDILENPIDKEKANDILINERNKAKEYLRNNLK